MKTKLTFILILLALGWIVFNVTQDMSKIENKYYHYVRELENQNHLPNLTKLDNKCNELGFLKSKDLGRGQIIVVSTKDVYNVISQEIKKNVNFLIKGNI